MTFKHMYFEATIEPTLGEGKFKVVIVGGSGVGRGNFTGGLCDIC